MSDAALPHGLVGVLSTITAPLLPAHLRALHAAGVENLCVILDSKALGEKDLGIWAQRTGGELDEPGLGPYDFADRGLRFYLVRSHNGPDCLALLDRLKPALLINCGTPRKLKAEVLAAPSQGVLNVHPGVLPKYRGSSCVEWAILNDDPVGNSAHFMTEGYDEGPIIATESYDVSAADDYRAIRVAVYRGAVRMMARTVRQLLDTGMTPADAQAQPPGDCFGPISEAQLAEVIAKVGSGAYAAAVSA